MDRLEWGDISSRRWLDHNHHLSPLYFFHPHRLATNCEVNAKKPTSGVIHSRNKIL
jgi:hypothetical protein